MMMMMIRARGLCDPPTSPARPKAQSRKTRIPFVYNAHAILCHPTNHFRISDSGAGLHVQSRTSPTRKYELREKFLNRRVNNNFRISFPAGIFD